MSKTRNQPAYPQPECRAYTIPQAQIILNVSRATLYRMIGEGRIASVKIMGCWRVTGEGIDAVLQGAIAE